MKLTEEQKLEILCQWVEEVPVAHIAGSLRLPPCIVQAFLEKRLRLTNPGHWGLPNDGIKSDTKSVAQRMYQKKYRERLKK